MSSAGLSNRIAYGPSFRSAALDAVAVAIENGLFLTAGKWLMGAAMGPPFGPTKDLPPRVPPPGYTPAGAPRPIRPRSPSGLYRRPRLRPFLAALSASGLSALWVMASWGDYVFQAETKGTLPSVWVVISGLRDPLVNAGAQLGAHRDIFLGGLARALLGFCIGVAYLFLSGGIRRADKNAARKDISEAKCARGLETYRGKGLCRTGKGGGCPAHPFAATA